MARSKHIITRPIGDNEEWRPVVDFEVQYSVSNLGNVRREGRARSTYPGRPLKPHLGNAGYYTVALRGRTTLVHRLVAEAFLEPEKRHLDVNHKNGNPTDNRVDNLEFVTHAENMGHARFTLGRKMRGIFTPEQVKEIRAEFARGVRQVELASRYGVKFHVIHRIVHRLVWKDVD
jgi:hypothetical protein